MQNRGLHCLCRSPSLDRFGDGDWPERSMSVTERIVEGVVEHVDANRQKWLDGLAISPHLFRLTIRRGTISLTVDSTKAVAIAAPWRCRVP
jgi:hypothetical protein